jgi:hypothetical protein
LREQLGLRAHARSEAQAHPSPHRKRLPIPHRRLETQPSRMRDQRIARSPIGLRHRHTQLNDLGILDISTRRDQQLDQRNRAHLA